MLSGVLNPLVVVGPLTNLSKIVAGWLQSSFSFSIWDITSGLSTPDVLKMTALVQISCHYFSHSVTFGVICDQSIRPWYRRGKNLKVRPVWLLYFIAWLTWPNMLNINGTRVWFSIIIISPIPLHRHDIRVWKNIRIYQII